jgi:hypothetical protein
VIETGERERRQPADRGDLHDPSRALSAQDGQRGLRDPQRAEQVDLDLTPGLFLGDLLDGPR